MKIWISLLLPCICFATMISAQKMRQIGLPVNTQFVRLNPTGLLDLVETNISAGYEYPYKNNWSVAADAAWIFYSRYFEHTKKASGFIFRPAVRRYTGSLKKGFLEAGLHYKYVVSTIEDWLGKNCVDGVAAYEEFTRFDYLRRAIGFDIKTGRVVKFSENNRLWFEYYIGIGARWIFQKVLHEPHSCYIYAGGPFGEMARSGRATVAIPCGFRLLYKLKK